MSRLARIYLPGYPYHIVQRGNNRQACFIDVENYQYYLNLWERLSARYGVAVHAYCLMTNHVHFLATPAEADSISRVTRDVGSLYARYMNQRYQRTGSLWEGRHKSSLVQSAKYLLTCYRYIELNPVAAKMVTRPEEYKWSTYGCNAWGDHCWISPHVEYLQLGKNRETRCLHYRELFRNHIDTDDLHRIRHAANYNQPLGDDRFKHAIEAMYGINLGKRTRGRPRKIETG